MRSRLWAIFTVHNRFPVVAGRHHLQQHLHDQLTVQLLVNRTSGYITTTHNLWISNIKLDWIVDNVVTVLQSNQTSAWSLESGPYRPHYRLIERRWRKMMPNRIYCVLKFTGKLSSVGRTNLTPLRIYDIKITNRLPITESGELHALLQYRRGQVVDALRFTGRDYIIQYWIEQLDSW